MLGLASCRLTERGIDPHCKAYGRFKRARGGGTPLRALARMGATLGDRHLGHPSAPVRLQAAMLLASASSQEGKTRRALEAAQKEQTAIVLTALLRLLGPRIAVDGKVKSLLLRHADHPDMRVRREAMTWMVAPSARGVDGVFETVQRHVEKDPAPELPGFLCARLYGSSDPRAIAVIETALTSPTTKQALFEGCWQGAIAAWTGFPKPPVPSKAAYELTLDVLERKPRTKQRPPWRSLRILRAARPHVGENDKLARRWLRAVEPWYDNQRLVAALESLIRDPKANVLARTAALDVLVEHDYPAEKFDALGKRYSRSRGDDARVREKCHEILGRLREGGGHHH